MVMKLPKFHSRVKELLTTTPETISAANKNIIEITSSVPNYVSLVELMAKEIEVLRDVLEEVYGLSAVAIEEHRLWTHQFVAEKALAKADELEKQTEELK